MKRRHVFFVYALLVFLSLGNGIAAAEDGDAPAAKANPAEELDPETLEAVAGTTAAEAPVSPDDLRLKLKPLTKDDLQAEVDAWMLLVKSKSKKLCKHQIDMRKKEGEEKEKAVAKETALTEERVVLVDCLNVALKALEEKGGDVEQQRQYISVISEMEFEASDVSGTWLQIVAWLKSEEGGIRWGLNLLKFILCILAFKILASILGRVTKKAVSKLKHTTEILREFFVNTVRRVTFIVGIIMALSFLEVDIGPILAAMGIAGFVIAFALQETLANFASGIMLLVYRPFDIGDAVSVAGATGKVDGMSLVSTNIKTFDNQTVVVPNSKIWGDVITNITDNATRRVDMVFGIGYSDDIAKAQAVMEEILKNHSLVLEKPESVIKVSELADSSVNFVVRPWVKTADYWTVYWDVTRSVKERFDAEGISIPFPQQDVYMHQVSEA